MASYISSNQNRFYAALESAYGTVPAITGANYFAGVRLTAQQRVQPVTRLDKTGTRTFVGLPSRLRRETTYEVQAYLTAWRGANQAPPLDAFVQGATGGSPQRFAGGFVSHASDGKTITFTGPHGLAVGQAVTFGGEIRFAAALVDASTIQLNVPFSMAPPPGSPIGAAISYPAATELRGVTVFDYWSPTGTVQRIISGAAVDEMRVKINGDFHELRFKGPARDVIDSTSFTAGLGGLAAFPAEPAEGEADYSVVPGNIGQVWIGTSPSQFFNVTEGEVVLSNDVETRSREFGTDLPLCLVPGQRGVTMNFAVYEQGAQQTRDLYQAARQRSPVSVMLQLGEQPGQMMGIYMKSVVPEVPEFDDSERRLQWRFSNSQAQGIADDEIVVAFG